MCDHIIQTYNSNKTTISDCFSIFVFPTTKKAKLMKSYLVCYECGSSSWKLVACGQCPHVACSNPCFQVHAAAERHVIGIDLNMGSTRCYICKDVVYHTAIEEHVMHLKYNLVDSREFYPIELVTGKNVNFLKNMKIKTLSPTAGYRGLINMGNTCYMNVIIQAIARTPVLSRFLMSGVHACPTIEASLDCLTCELSRIIQEMYSDNQEPIAPARFLMLVWKHLGFATNTMQDAHELYIGLVDKMHNELHKTSGYAWPNNALCPCVVDGVFSGEWLSTRQCTNCHTQSSRTEFYRDLAIDLSGLRGSNPNNELLSADEMADLSIDDASVRAGELEFPIGAETETESDTLNDCLNWFMRREPITFTCEQCHSKQCFKQFSPWRPPCVLVVHLKRFENVLDKPKRHVNNTYVSFTEEIMVRENTKYRLYCAVVHTGSNYGKNSGGHYFCYVRGKVGWIRINDDEMTFVPQERVFTSNAYLLFYQLIKK